MLAKHQKHEKARRETGKEGESRGTQGTFHTTQGNRLSCRDQEGRRGSEEAVPGPSVFPSGSLPDPCPARLPRWAVGAREMTVLAWVFS